MELILMPINLGEITMKFSIMLRKFEESNEYKTWFKLKMKEGNL